jgi:NADH-quinone oxidoreductase subunit K
MVVPLPYVLGLSVVLFALGAIGVLIRRNILIILMCLEMMLNAVNLAFIGFADHFKAVDGQMFVFFVLTVAAAEVAVGLALVVAIFRQRASVYVDDLNILKW